MRKLSLLLTTMLLLLRHPAVGQQPVVFDTVRFNQVGSFAIGFTVFQTDSGYMVFANEKGIAGISQDVYTTRFGPEGAFASESSFATYQQDDFGTSAPVARAEQSYFMGSSRGGFIGPMDSLFLYKFDAAGDTLWSRFIATDTSLVQRATTLAANGDLLLAGTRDPGRKAYIFHLDSVGNIKGYHPYPGFNGEDVVVGRDGKWYVCGLGNQGVNYSHAVLVCSDTLGAELWRRTDQAYGRYVSLVAMQDNGVVALGSHLGSDDLPYAHVIKYDSMGAVVWSKDLWSTFTDSWPCRIHAGYEYPDSTLVIAGTLRDTISRDAGMISKLDKNGDALWHRFYSHYPGAAYGKDQIFWDVKPTSDGGMVLTGETNSDDYPYAQLWLLKLDSMGCLVPGCGSVGVEEYLDALQPLLRVSPNPSSDVVHVALDLPEGAAVKGDVRVVLLDATGRLVLEQRAVQSLNALRATIDVSALPAGTYYLHLRDAKRWLAGSKLVVE